MAEHIEYVVRLRGGPQTAAEFRSIATAANTTHGSIKRVGAVSEHSGKQVGGLEHGFRKMASALLAVGAGYAAWNAAKGAIRYTSELAKNTSALSKTTGMATGETSKLVAVSQALGIEANTLGGAFTKLSSAALKQVSSSSKTASAFDRLGIGAKEVRAHMHDMPGLLELVVQRAEAMPGGIEKSQGALELFGRSWLSLAPLLGEGSGQFSKWTKMAKDFGLELGGDPLESMRKLHDQQIEYTLATNGLRVAFTKMVAGPLGHIIAGFSKLAGFAAKGEWGKFNRQLTILSSSLIHLAEKVMPKVAEGFAKIAPKVFMAFVHGFFSASTGGQAVLAGVLLTKLGLTSAVFKEAGTKTGGAFGAAFVIGAVAAAYFAARAALHGAAALTSVLSAPSDAAAAEARDPHVQALRRREAVARRHGKDPEHFLHSVEAFNRRYGTERVQHLRNMVINVGGNYSHKEKLAALEWLRHHHDPGIPHVKGLAGGGMVTHGGLVEVGERGPEMLTLPQGAQVAPLSPGSLSDNRDIVIKVDGKELARVNRKQQLESMAANA